jgi:hypothetical protein
MKIYPGYQAIFVAADVEYNPPVPKDIGAVEHPPDRRQTSPGRSPNHPDQVRNGNSASRSPGISQNAFNLATEMIRIRQS